MPSSVPLMRALRRPLPKGVALRLPIAIEHQDRAREPVIVRSGAVGGTRVAAGNPKTEHLLRAR
jgi:hypothetical protein